MLTALLLALAAPVPLFDGKSFAGWDGDIDKTWRIEDGVLVGGSLDKVVPRNEFLCTKKSFGDFELKVEFRLLGDRKQANAGVQFRTKRIPKHHEVSGYQADVGQGYWGALYDESRRNKVLAAPKKEVVEKLIKHDDWNEYRIRAEGPRIRLWLNGTLTVDYTEEDPKIERDGIIGLQVHGGAKTQVFYRKVTIEEIKADGPPKGFTALTPGKEYGDVELRFEFNGKGEIGLRGAPLRIDGAKDGWNSVRVVLVGERTTVGVNGKTMSDHARMGNTAEPKRALPRTGPIRLPADGTRNVLVREISSEEANKILREHDADGFKGVFNGKDFTGWTGPLDNYEVKDGAIVCKPKKGGNIHTKDEYADFIARVEYRLPAGGNNGLAIRYPGTGQPSQVAMCEIQLLDDDAPKYKKLDPRQYNGSVYGMIPALRGYLRPTGEWNFMEVTVRGHRIRVELNGTRIVEGDVSKVTEFMGGKENPGRLRTKGYFGFAGHSDPVAFRLVRIKPLTSKVDP